MLRKVLFCMFFIVLATGYSQVSKVLFSGARSVPKMLNYQGYLTDTLGSPIEDSLDMLFEIYDLSTGGSVLWQEQLIQVPVERGVFSVLLGVNDPLPDTVFTEGTSRWLELTLEGTQTLSPRTRITAVGYAYTSTYSDTAEYSKNAAADNDWVRGTPDSVLFTANKLGIARGGANNMLYGDSVHTHVNLGVACTTGTSGQNHRFCTVSGGWYNSASGGNAIVGGGKNNSASAEGATVGGGYYNTASGHNTTVGGGNYNTADTNSATVGGGGYNTASGLYAIVSGGSHNTASGRNATVGGGHYNTADTNYATVGGGWANFASGYGATVGGGRADTAAASYSFATNYSTYVLAGHINSAAFTVSHTIASNQVRAAAFSTGTMAFTLDHPSDPMNKILNQYAVGSSEMMFMYNGTAYIGANSRIEVVLPDYFDKINRNPRIQLTGVGTSDVYVAEDISENRFTIGGKQGTKVYWTVTAERKDMHAEIARILTPVEQPKTGDLIGHSLDDDALIGIYDRLESKRPGVFRFRTAEGRRVHEESKRIIEERRKERR